MKVCTCLLLLGLLAHISSTTRIKTKKHYRDINPRARIIKKTDFDPISSNEMTIKATVPKKPTTTTTPRYSSKDESDSSKTTEDLRTNHDSDDTNHDFTNVKTKFKLRVGQDDDKQRKHFKPDESKSKNKHTNTHNIGEYNAVIDVQLANTELLNGLGIFEPVTDKISKNSSAYQRSFQLTKPVHKKPTPKPTAVRVLTEIKPKKTQRTARFKPPSRYLKPLSKLRINISTLLLEESELIKQLMKDHILKQKPLTRRNAGTVLVKSFNEYVVKRLDILERDLQKLKHMNDLRIRSNCNETDDVIVSNVTDKYNTPNKRIDFKANVVRLANKNKDWNEKENSTVNTESTTKDTTYSKPTVVNADTVIDDKNTSQVTNNILNDAEELSTDKNNNIETTITDSSVEVTDSSELEAFVTGTAGVATRLMESDYYSEPNLSLSYSQMIEYDQMNEDL